MKSLYSVTYRVGFIRRHIDVTARDTEHAKRRLLKEKPQAKIELVELVAQSQGVAA